MNTIGIFIITRDDKALLIQRKQRDKQTSPWVFPADTIDADNVVESSAESIKTMLGVTPNLEVIKETQHTGTGATAYYVGGSVEGQFDLSDAVLKTRWVTAEDLDGAVQADIDPSVTRFLTQQ